MKTEWRSKACYCTPKENVLKNKMAQMAMILVYLDNSEELEAALSTIG